MGTLGPLLLTLLLQAQVPAGEIRGSVLGERGAGVGPLAFAMIEMATPAGYRSVLSGEGGRFHLPDVPAGVPVTLRAVHVGYEETRVEVTVAPGSTVTLDLLLGREPVELPGVRVDSRGLVAPPPLEGGRLTTEQRQARAELALRALDASPGMVEAGLVEAVGRPPGSDPSDPADVLFMRGSTTDAKLVLLDGAPVYTPFHLGGLLRSFDEEVLGSATHHVGGAPARYDGGLSSILELRTRAPASDRLRLAGAFDLMSGRATAETPLGNRARVLFSTRALHDLQGRLAGAEASPYGYIDGLARAEIEPLAGHTLSLMAFGNEESVRLRLPDAEAESVPLAEGFLGRSPESARWANAAASATWSAVGEQSRLDVTAALSRYRADLPVPQPRSVDDPAADAGPPQALLVTGSTGRARLTMDWVRFGEAGSVRAGAAFDRSHLRLGARGLASMDAGENAYGRGAEGTVLGAYVDVTRRLGPGLHVRSGLRVDRFEPGGTRPALRLAFLWNLTDAALLTLAGGRYHQLIRTTDAGVELAMGSEATAGTGGLSAQVERYPLLSLATADHVLLSLDQELAPGLRLTTEGFYKSFEGLDGLGRETLDASGVDLRVLREGERLTAWLGYSLSWFWEHAETPGGTQAFTGRHLLSAGMSGQVVGPWGVDLQLAFSDGLPLTSIPFSRDAAEPLAADGPLPSVASAQASAPETASSETFLRLDVEVFADFEPTWGDHTFRLRPYLRVLNALDRRDALFYYFEPWREAGLRPLAELSVIPVVGLAWRF